MNQSVPCWEKTSALRAKRQVFLHTGMLARMLARYRVLKISEKSISFVY